MRTNSDAWFLHHINDNKLLSATTKAIYARRYRQLKEKLPKKTFKKMLENPQSTFTAIKEIADGSPSITDQFVQALMSFFEHANGFRFSHNDAFNQWKAIQKDVKKPIEEKYLKNEPTEKQKEAYVPWNEIITQRDSLPADSPERLLLSMYTFIPPMRNDYAQVRIFRRTPRNDKGNYIVINSTRAGSKIVLQEYKTASTYGKLETPLPNNSPLYKVLKESLVKRPREYLFTTTTGLKYSSENAFGKWANRQLQTLFGKPITLTTFRHSYLSSPDMQQKLRDSTQHERDIIARSMGHSGQMQQGYYLRGLDEPPLAT